MGENLQYDPMRQYSITDAESVSQATYLAVAEVEGCDPLDLPPIAGTIDADALDALFNNSRRAGDLQITFEYAGKVVTVTPEVVHVESP